MPTQQPNTPQQDLDTGIFVEGHVPPEVNDAIGITTSIIRLLQRAGIIGALPKVPIHIQQKGQNQVEIKLTFAHGTIQEIQKGIVTAIKVAFATIGLSLLAGGVIGYSCSKAMDDSPKSSFSSSQTK